MNTEREKKTLIKGKHDILRAVLTIISSFDTLFLLENPLIYDLSQKNVNRKRRKVFFQLPICFEPAAAETISN